jgi:hypothetical protein
MGFFDDRELKDEPIRSTYPDWFEPPTRIIGKPLGNTVVMSQTADCAVVLNRFVAYPDGLDWEITVRFADHVPLRAQMAFEGFDRAMWGIRHADGTAIFPYQSDEWPPKSRPEGIVLHHHGGRGDDFGMTFGLWLNPLPTEPFHMIFAWKSVGIDEIEAEVNIANLAEEAAKALILWPAHS